MPVYSIRGVDVDFPYDAYGCQLDYMDRILQSLQQRKNALLESPTGTGKTLCLLCAALAWRRTFGDFLRCGGGQPGGSQSSSGDSGNPVIVYASRTHSQLRQVIKELKATAYRPKMAVLGSREQMCIHDEVSQIRGKMQNSACQFLCKQRWCRHQNLVTEYMRKNSEIGNEPFDIEDLVNIGKTNGPCPYYISRELSKSVDILFAPYNYLIDPGNRRSLMGIPWDNAVLIFDEAHNLESICAEAASFDLHSSYLASCIAEAQQCVSMCVAKRSIENFSDKQYDPENYAILKALLMSLEKRIGEVVIESKQSGFTKPGKYIYEFLSDLNLTSETSKMLIDTIDSASLLLEEGNSAETGGPPKTKGIVCRLETIRDILDIIFRGGGQTHAKYYCFHVEESEQTSGDLSRVLGKGSRTLSWWCFNPGLAMEEFVKLGVRSIILTSGTLSPLDSFAMELNLEFPVRLENPHVISPNQLWVGVMPVGPSGYSLNSSYRTRDTLEYKQELGNAIVNFARIVPDGLLVFFPSYYMMNRCIECWKSMNHASSVDDSTTWQRICKYKKPVVEPRQSSNFSNAIEDYATKLRDPSSSGAIFFAVCRGKVSEGLDFADRAGRAVLVTGMPFSPMTDPKIQLKREYLDRQATSSNKSTKALTGEAWYLQQAARAVNQAVGRVIRHRHDYGAIIYCDERFAWQNYKCQMSYWIRPHIKLYSKFGEVVQTLTKFFRDNVSSYSSEPKQLDCNDNIVLAEDKSSPQKFHTNLAATSVDEPRGITLSLNATTSNSNYSQLAHVTPANRSTLSTKHSYSPTSQLLYSADQLSHDAQVVNLTSNAPKCGLLTEHAFKSLGLKRAKTTDKTKCSLDFGNVSSNLLHNVNSGALAENKAAQPTLPSARSTSEEGSKKNEAIQGQGLPSGSQDSTSGAAFLKLAQESLTAAEYKEFVGYMKAIKSKTMHSKDSLTAIVRLFSSRGRLPLLEGFRVFIPQKYVDLYEQIVRTYALVTNM